MDLAKSLRVGLARQNKTARWLSEQTGWSEQMISDVRKERKRLPPDRLESVAEAFGVPVSEFIKWGEE